MDSDWLTIMDRIDDFHLAKASSDTWDRWYKQFTIFLRATSFDKLPSQQKAALLLVKNKAFGIILGALGIEHVGIEYDDLVSELTRYFNPINARMAFYNRKQKRNESFEHFVGDLKVLSGPCQFRDPKILRDMFLCNMNDDHKEVARMIQSKFDPSLEEAVAAANAFVGYVDIADTREQYNATPPPSSNFPHVKSASMRIMPMNDSSHTRNLERQSLRGKDSHRSHEETFQRASFGRVNDRKDDKRGQANSVPICNRDKRQSGRTPNPEHGFKRAANPGLYTSSDDYSASGAGSNRSNGGHNSRNDGRPRSAYSADGAKNRGSNGVVNGAHSAFARVKTGTTEQQFIPRSVEQKRAANLSTSRAKKIALPSSQPGHCPVPLDCFTLVHVMHKSSTGTIFCMRKDRADAFKKMKSDISNLEDADCEPLGQPQEGDLVLFFDELHSWVRGEIFKIHPDGKQVKIKYLDVGCISKTSCGECYALPQNFWDVEPFAFPIEVSEGVAVENGENVFIKPMNVNDDGSWRVSVKRRSVKGMATPELDAAEPPAKPAVPSPSPKPTAAMPRAKPAMPPPSPKPTVEQPVLKSTSIRSRPSSRGEHSRPPHPPPIPRISFSRVKVVHVGPEGVFGIEYSKMDFIGDIQEKISNMNYEPLQESPSVGSLYLAPFEGEVFRARVTAPGEDSSTYRVTFVDFGNECELPVEDLYCIPDELQGHIHTFKIGLDPNCNVTPEVGDVLEMTPVALQADGSWLVRLKPDISSSQNSSPDDDDDR